MADVDENDMSIFQSMMSSNIDDRRNPYHVVPPLIRGGAEYGEKSMTWLPSTLLPPDEQRASADFRAGMAQEALTQEDMALQPEGPTTPITPELVRAMRYALRPDLEQMNRPNASVLRSRRRFMKSLNDDTLDAG